MIEEKSVAVMVADFLYKVRDVEDDCDNGSVRQERICKKR